MLMCTLYVGSGRRKTYIVFIANLARSQDVGPFLGYQEDQVAKTPL